MEEETGLKTYSQGSVLSHQEEGIAIGWDGALQGRNDSECITDGLPASIIVKMLNRQSDTQAIEMQI